MKIFIVTSYAESLVNFRLRLIKELIGRGVDVLVSAPGITISQRNILETIGAKVYSVPLNRSGKNPFGDFIYLLRISSLFAVETPDIVFAYFLKPVAYAPIAARLSRVKRVVSMLEGMGSVFTYSNTESYKQKLFAIFVLKILKIGVFFSDEIIVLNEFDKKTLIEERVVSERSQLTCLGPIGVDLEKFVFTPPSSKKPIRFLFIGRLLKEKGIIELLESMKLLEDKGINAKLEIVGSVDPDKPSSLSQKDIDYYNKIRGVRFLGYVENVVPQIQKCHVVVLPSYREGYPVCVQEAMAVGRPVILSDSTGCYEVVSSSGAAIKAETFSVQDLAEKMIWASKNLTKLAEMGLAARLFAELNFDSQKINSKLADKITYDF